MGFISSFCIRWYQKQSWIMELKVRFTCPKLRTADRHHCGHVGGGVTGDGEIYQGKN